MRSFICFLLSAYTLVLLAWVVLSYFPRATSGSLRPVWRVLHALTDPVLRPLRGMLPPVRAGAIGFDLSPLIAFVIIAVLTRAIC